MNRKFFIAWIVMFIAYMAGGFIIHHGLLGQDYKALPNLFRAEEDARPIFYP